MMYNNSGYAGSQDDSGFSGALNITVPKEPVQGVVGESVLLPVTYSVPQPPDTLQVIWNHENLIILLSEMTMCDPTTPPSQRISKEYYIVAGMYQERVVFYPENASLLLRNAQRNDSGRYTVTFQELNQSRSMMLIIRDPVPPSSDPDSTQSLHNVEERDDRRHFSQSLVIRGMCAAIFFLLIISLHCAWWRQARKTEIV
ncbi:HEPACAM family member 2-like [Rhinoderma darwinii]|uniref:HEPACAM family member 2-like n=1 Tax=Rhinoderma darwinii TaxID=43563 RepID=UPI003F6628B7